MGTDNMTEADLLWRLAPWLFLVAIALTVVSFPPARGVGHGHGAVHGQSGSACEQDGHRGHAMEATTSDSVTEGPGQVEGLARQAVS